MELLPFVNLSVVNLGDDDDLLLYRLALSNGESATMLEFWAYADAFKEFGQQLAQFPLTAKSRVTFQIGQQNPRVTRWAYCLQLDVFCYLPNGASVIHTRLEKPDSLPFHYSSEFFLRALPADLNRLGQKLLSWVPREQEELTWRPSL